MEMICLSLDFESFKKCLKVSKAWSGVLTNKVFLTKVKLVFSKDILQEELTLRKMSREGDAYEVRRILSSGLVNVDCGDGVEHEHEEDHGTPLKLAATMGHPEIVRLLINAGANVNWCGPTDLERASPLIEAVTYHKIEVVKLLIDEGACIDQTDWAGRTALQYASFSGCVDGVKLLLDNGADVNSADEYGTTSLIYVIRYGVHDVATTSIAKLLIERGADLDKLDADGETPLNMAVRNNMLEIVKLLIDHGASPTHDPHLSD